MRCVDFLETSTATLMHKSDLSHFTLGCFSLILDLFEVINIVLFFLCVAHLLPCKKYSFIVLYFSDSFLEVAASLRINGQICIVNYSKITHNSCFQAVYFNFFLNCLETTSFQ